MMEPKSICLTLPRNYLRLRRFSTPPIASSPEPISAMVAGSGEVSIPALEILAERRPSPWLTREPPCGNAMVKSRGATFPVIHML